jgi:hypothetical protein
MAFEVCSLHREGVSNPGFDVAAPVRDSRTECWVPLRRIA